MPPALPDGFVCPPGTVPGWLNGDLLPTSCVGDAPNTSFTTPHFTAPVAPLEPNVYEVAFYVYKKLDPTLPAAWENSGVQDLIVAVPGTDWFTEFPGDLPAYVCGPGWGVQQDLAKHDGFFVWPESIEFPDDNIGWPPLYAAKHSELSEFIAVPDCVTEVVVTAPPAPPVLAATGDAGVLQAGIWVAAVLTVAGFITLVARWSHSNSPLPLRKRRKGN